MGFGGNPKDTSAVRGGPAFEVLFNVHNMLKKKGLRDKFELTFFAPMEKPGLKMGHNAVDMMHKMFKMTNIHTQIGSKIINFEENAINFENGTKLESDLIMYISAGTGHNILENSGLPLSDAKFVVTNEYNEIDGFDGIYAIGDSASLMGPEWRAKQGHVQKLWLKMWHITYSKRCKKLIQKEAISNISISYVSWIQEMEQHLYIEQIN